MGLSTTATERETLRHRVLDGLRDGTLKPRYHNGIGFAQVYLDKEVRLHVWRQEFPNIPEAFGTRHNHRYDFISTVLVGAMTNITLDYRYNPTGYFRLYKIQPAHLGPADPILDETVAYDIVVSKIEVVPAGESYTFPKGVYHEGRSNGITATILKKLNQEDSWAGILAPADQEPEHGMARETITQDELLRLMIETVEMFDERAWDAIARALADG